MKFLVLFLFSLLALNSYAGKITDDVLKIGQPGSGSDKVIQLGDTREIRSNEATGSLEFTNDGSVYKKIGSGAGGGAGINVLLNPSFEDGVSDWVNTSGVLTSEDTVVIDGVKSAKVTLTAQTLDFYQTITNTEWNGKTAYASCHIKSTVADVQVCFFDGTTEYNCMDYDASDVWKKANGFISKVASGLMGVKVKTKTSQTGAVYIDNCIVGDQIQVGTSVTRHFHHMSQNGSDMLDVSGSVGFNLGTANIDETGSNGFSVTNVGNVTRWTALLDTSFNAQASFRVNDSNVRVLFYKNGSLKIEGSSSYASGARSFGSISLPMSEGDYLEVHTTNSVLNDANLNYVNVDTLSVTSGLAVPGEIGSYSFHGIDITGNGSSGTHIPRVTTVEHEYNTQFIEYHADSTNGDYWEVKQDVIATGKWNAYNAGGTQHFAGWSVDASSLTTSIVSIPDVEKLDAIEVVLGVQRNTTVFTKRFTAGSIIRMHTDGYTGLAGSDATVTITAYPIYMKLLAQVPFPVDNSRGNIREESCRINNNGTATIDTGSGLCESWMSAVTRVGAGLVRIQFISGIFSKLPICQFTSIRSLGDTQFVTIDKDEVWDKDEISIKSANPNPITLQDHDFNISCKGVK